MSPYEPPTEDGPDPDLLRDEAWDRKHLGPSVTVERVHEHKFIATIHRSCGCDYTATPDASHAQAVRTGNTLLTRTVCQRCRTAS